MERQRGFVLGGRTQCTVFTGIYTYVCVRVCVEEKDVIITGGEGGDEYV